MSSEFDGPIDSKGFMRNLEADYQLGRVFSRVIDSDQEGR